MAASRRPNALGQGPALESGSAQNGHDPRKPIEADEERTTVDEGPPSADGDSDEDRWEEKTHREGAGPRTPPKGMPQSPLLGEDSGEVLRDTIDRGGPVDDDEDEPTVRADESHFPVNPATGGTGTMDEPTVEDQARPLPPLSALPPLPLAKPPAGKSPAAARKPSPATARIVVTAGNDSGREFELSGHRVVVGRGIDCDVVLTDIAVSRKHMELTYDGQHYTLRDLGSGNGTLINDRLEDGACQLQHSDRLELGNTIIRFEHSASKADQAVVGFGNQVEVDEEASTIAGRGRAKPEPQPLSAGLLARATQGAAQPDPRPSPSVLSDLVLPASPPGAAIAANSPHAPMLAAGAATPGANMLGVGGAAAASPLAAPMPGQAIQGDGGFSDALPPIADPVALGAPPQFEGELLLPVRRNRILIGIISGVLGLVLIAIVATVLRGGSESKTASTAPKKDLTEPPSALRPLTAEPEASDDKVAAKATDDTAAAKATDDTAAAKATDDEAAAKAIDDKPVETEPTRELSPDTWGTNEVLLAARTNGLLSRALTDKGPAKAVTEKVTEKPKPVRRAAVDKPKKRTKPSKPKRTTAKRRAPKRKPKPRVATAKRKHSSSSSAVRGKAADLYRSKSFNTAANMLRTAAADASEDDATELRSLASNYEAVGTSLAKARQTQSSNPTGSMASYRRALRLDKKAGDGVHATYIRLQLGRVAPKAAASYMAQKRYEAAKKAADAAVNYGAGGDPTVRRVRKALERQAGIFYKEAQKLQKKNPTGAKKLLRRVLKMVPADSPWYTKAYKIVNARSKPRDEDE